ncbi:hypothetical protein F442_20919 [Phytophthora nicotianae P10297]|uniref:Uncharacterized protein n=1 Tax=Phytophthora nicotianae P10297 TaxID=1317064 RepID=W2Y4H0_PHYNI|nr:hypothetical protein F442_20919 [Phytophthora nicotianae P10297]
MMATQNLFTDVLITIRFLGVFAIKISIVLVMAITLAVLVEVATFANVATQELFADVAASFIPKNQ